MKAAAFARSATTRARAAILWAGALFVVLQVALFIAMSTRWQALRDPDWGSRLARLEARLSERPGRPLLLVLGSSRAGVGIRPDELLLKWSSDSPVAFNFARRGFGPMVSLLYLRRLLDEGIRPDWVLVEFWPFFLASNNVFGRDDGMLDPRRLQWRDRAAVERDANDGRAQMHLWMRLQLVPWFWHRSILMGYFAPRWGNVQKFGEDFWAETDEWGWREVRSLTHDRFAREVERQRPELERMVESFALDPTASRRLSDILELSRENGIPISLLYMPESSDLRAGYSSSMLEQVNAYLQSLEQRYAVPVIDARDWMPDECFGDIHHLTTTGATLFSRRLAEVTGLPQEGRPLAASGAVAPARVTLTDSAASR
jgi:hypothetical protein